MRVVITGTNRGIGLELARQYLARGDTVEAGVRDMTRAEALRRLGGEHPGRLRIHPCDVTDDDSVRAFARAVGQEPVDVLINNAGVLGKLSPLEELDFEDMLHTYSVNALGALRVTVALLPAIRKSTVRKIAHLSSGMASIADNTSGGAYGYRMSKAALNMASRSLAVDLRDEGIISVVINPGWVRTDMGGAGAPTPVEVSVAGIIARIDAMTMEDSGSFLSWRGHKLPW